MEAERGPMKLVFFSLYDHEKPTSLASSQIHTFMRMRRGPSVTHTYLWLWFPGIKLVRQQENPIQEKHRQVPRGSQHVCGEDCRQRNQRVGSRQPGQLPVYSQLGRWGKAHKSHIITACHGSVGTFFPTKLEDFFKTPEGQ